MRRAYLYRLYPNKGQAAVLEELLETHRRLYNDALAERRDAYEQDKRSLGLGEQKKAMAVRRRENPWLLRCNQNSCQRTLMRLDRAFDAFFRRVKANEKPGYPRFRGRGRFDTVEFTYNNGAKLLENGRVRLQTVGDVKVKLHRPVQGAIKTAAFSRRAGRWYVVFSCELPDPVVEPSANPPVGIDLGLKAFLVTSDGEMVDPPRYYREAQRRLRRIQRSVSRKKKGGTNRRKAVRNLARLHLHISNKRKDFHHKTARNLVGRYGLIAHEDLNVKGLSRGKLSKSVHDAGWAQFLTVLGHKAEEAGVSVVAVDPRNTTQACSVCGGLPDTPIGLRVRTYTCRHCGFTMDRDRNAAINILARTGPSGVKPGNGPVCPGTHASAGVAASAGTGG